MSKKGDTVRAQIIDSANQLFYRRGFQATSFSDLATESGVPKGNFYFHFKSKEALLDAVIARRIENLKNQLDHWAETLTDPKDRLRRAVRMIEVEQKSLISHGCPIGTLLAELVKNQVEQKRHLAEMLRLIETWMADQIFSLTNDEAASRRKAQSMLRQMQGAATLAAAYEETRIITDTVTDLDQAIEAL